ncbi:MAG: hypothetical protein IJH65_04325 [Methanobrevibacter sp.]|nr:hypothetical protein [Methanobrevibacter sp.]
MRKQVFRCKNCGSIHKRPYFLLLIYHVFSDDYYLVCDVCNHTSHFPLHLTVGGIRT